MRKTLALALALMMLLSAVPFSAFAQEAAYDWLLDTTPITLTLFEDWPTTVVDDENSLALKRIEEITGVRLERQFPVAWDGQQLALMLASDSLPDIIVIETGASWRSPFIEQARQAGAIWAYDDLIEQYAPNFKDLVAPEYFEMFKSEDGKTYEYVNAINTAIAQEKKQEFGAVGSAGATLIRGDFYEVVGSPDVSTPDGFIDALKKLKEAYPDRIPFITPADVWKSPISDFSAQFGVPPYHVEEGKVYDQLKAPSAVEAAVFLNRLAREGLMPKEAILEGTDVQAMVFNGEVISYWWNTRDEGKVPDDNPETTYTSLPPFTSWHSYNSATVGGWKTILISKKCKNPDRAVRLMEFMASEEGHRVLYWGNLGESPANGGSWSGDMANGPHYYLDEKGKPTYYQEYWAAKLADWDGVAVQSGLKEICYGEDSYYANVQTWMTDDPVAQKEALYYTGKTDYTPWFGIKVVSGSEEDNILTKIKMIKKNYVASVAFAKSEEECRSQYAAMLQEMEDAGLAQLEAYYTAQYEELMAKYN